MDDEKMVYIVRGRPGQYDRPALPAGHPISWGAITKNTILDNIPYPYPIFEVFYNGTNYSF